MTDLVIVSMHEKGFPQADMYVGCGEMPTSEFNALGAVPDDFFTMKRGSSLEDAKKKARAHWPDSKIVEGADEDSDDDES